MTDKKTFWTPKRLVELRIKARTLSLTQLSTHFSRTPEDIQNAIRFEANRRKLYIGTRIDVIDGKRVKISCFAPEYAAYAKEVPISWSSPELF